jgi:hypothetical protein
VTRLSKKPHGWASSDARVAERIVRFTEQFFDQLDALLPQARGVDGTPSVTDFLLLELPPVRDLLASEFEYRTTPTRDPDVRVYLGIGVLVKELALFAALDPAGQVEVFWVSFVRHEPETK